MSNLRSAISALAAEFADGVLRALHKAPLSELTGLGTAPSAAPRRGRGRPRSTAVVAPPPPPAAAAKKTGTRLAAARPGARRTTQDFEKLAAAIVSVVGEAGGKGLRSEQIQKALGLAKKDVVRPIQIALENRQLRKKGQRRGTTYFAS